MAGKTARQIISVKKIERNQNKMIRPAFIAIIVIVTTLLVAPIPLVNGASQTTTTTTTTEAAVSGHNNNSTTTASSRSIKDDDVSTTATTTSSSTITTVTSTIRRESAIAAAAAVTTSTTVAASGYDVAQTLDFAKSERMPVNVAVVNSSSGPVAIGPAMSNSHQNGMLLMAMLLDNKSYIESGESKPALALFDFNPEDIQDLDGNDFYSVDGSSNMSDATSENQEHDEDNHVEETSNLKPQKTSSKTASTNTRNGKNVDIVEEEEEEEVENAWTLPLVMKTNGQMLPGSASAAAAVVMAAAAEGGDGSATTESGVEDSDGNIYKVKLKRRTDTKKRERERDRHRSISSQMNVLANEVTTITQFQTLTTMFDHWQWRPENIAEHVSKQCAQDLDTYLASLNAGELWALKVSDSSGRYRGQFIFGNVFWMGSKEFCQDVNYHNQVDRMAKKKKQKAIVNMHYLSTTLKLDLYSLVNKTKIIQVGQCLPESCSPGDVEMVLKLDPSFVKFNEMESKELSADLKSKGSITMVASRNVPGPYDLWTDKRFQILGIITVVVFIVVMIATMVEAKIESDDSKFSTKNGISCNNNNNGMQMKNFETNKNGNGAGNMNGDTQITVLSSEITGKGFKDNVDTMKENELNNSGRKCPSEQNIVTKFLLCFSLISNGKAIMCLKTPAKDSLTSIHGIRLFSLLWTIMVHTYLQLFAIGENRYGRKIAERSFGYQMIGNASFAVDTFFFLSGLLVALLFLRKGERASRQSSVFSFVRKSSTKASLLFIYRYLRLTPVYLVAIIANELSLKHTYNQSVFSPSIYDHITCHHFWFRNILYINNWYPFQELCMIWSWYLANDMQFYVLATFLLILSTRLRKTAIVITIVTLFASIIASAVISLKNSYMYKVADPFEAFDILYDKPWLRVGPYIMGMIGGYILSKWAKPPKISWLLNITLWICSIIIQFLLVFGTWDGILTVPKTAIYVSIGHAAWGLSLLWMVISCYWGLAPPVNKLLSYRAFLPLSRLTYCTYLLHPMIMVITSFRMEAPFHLQHVLILTAFLGNAIIAFIVALIVSLLFEAPVIRVLKLIFRK